MPNRIIKESICTSDNIDRLTPFQENVFIRLMVNCDDFGRFDARPKILSSRLFPLKSISPEDMEEALNALISADLVTVYMVGDHPFLFMNTWERHQQRRAAKSKFPSPDEGIIEQKKTDDINCDQMISDECKCPRNRNRESLFENRESSSLSEGFIDDDEAHKLQNDHDRILDAAKDAGFKGSNSENAALLRFYADYGLEKVLEGISACMEHSAPNIAYLGAVLKGNKNKPSGKPSGRVLPAQDFQQRDYSEVQKQLEKEQHNHIVEMLCRNNGLWDEINNCPVEGWRAKLDQLEAEGRAAQ